MISAWVYETGIADLEEQRARLERRIARGRERVGDREELENLTTSIGELRAYRRADLRIELELLADGIADPLAVALIQAEELLVDGLTLRTIPPETREALRRYREADWSVLLFNLDGSGGNSATP